MFRAQLLLSTSFVGMWRGGDGEWDSLVHPANLTPHHIDISLFPRNQVRSMGFPQGLIFFCEEKFGHDRLRRNTLEVVGGTLPKGIRKVSIRM